MEYNKLVRDKIPEIIDSSEVQEARFSVIENSKQFELQLYKKLQEEIEEFRVSSEPEEMADIFEVLDKIMELHGVKKDNVEYIKEQKKNDKGGFDYKYLLEEVKTKATYKEQNKERLRGAPDSKVLMEE